MAPKTTTGTVSYFEPPTSGEAPYIYVYKRDGEEPQTNFSRTEKKIVLKDMRTENLTLLDHGVELHKLKVPSDINWENQDEVRYTNFNSTPSGRAQQ